jgi:hypothetical protein
MSRTFIRSRLNDNPDLAKDGEYARRLDALPEELRRVYRDGDFTVGIKDDDWQAIPTAWIEAAMQRWTPAPPKGLGMTAMAVDVAQGGADQTTLAYRYGGWFGEIDWKPGTETKDGNSIAAMVVRRRRDRCPVVVDVGGGWGGDAVIRLKDNGIDVVAHNGVVTSNARTNDGAKLKFFNKRAEAYWRFREALDPEQEGGSVVALPRRSAAEGRSRGGPLQARPPRPADGREGADQGAHRPFARPWRCGGDVPLGRRACGAPRPGDAPRRDADLCQPWLRAHERRSPMSRLTSPAELQRYSDIRPDRFELELYEPPQDGVTRAVDEAPSAARDRGRDAFANRGYAHLKGGR